MCITESFCCTAEIGTRVKINHTSRKKKILQKRVKLSTKKQVYFISQIRVLAKMFDKYG